MSNFVKEIKDRVLVYDGSKGFMLQRYGLKGGECPELWNVTHEDVVKSIYEMYRDAGADVIQTNTLLGNSVKLSKYGLGDRVRELNYTAARLAREVMGRNGYVAASIGPIGILLEPAGELTFQEAYDIYKEQVEALLEGGVDIINFETFTDLAEMRAALFAAKDAARVPVICSLAFENNGKTLMGTDPYTAVLVLRSLGADMVGANCSFGPKPMLEIIKVMYEAGGIYLMAKPNAGLPEFIDGRAVYSEPPESFASCAPQFVEYGVRLIGGCCGTTPEFVKAIKESLKGLEVPPVPVRCEKVITSGVKTLKLDGSKPLDIGRLDALNEELRRCLQSGDLDSLADMALDLASEGFDAVYINLDGIREEDSLLAEVVNRVQGYLKEPVIIETKNCRALDEALRIYRGKAGVVMGTDDLSTVEELVAVAKKYGSTLLEKDFISAE